MSENDKHAEFMALFMQCQHDMRAFVAASLSAWDRVDDVMQDLAVVLWKKFDDYDHLLWILEIYKEYSKLVVNRLLFTHSLMLQSDTFKLERNNKG